MLVGLDKTGAVSGNGANGIEVRAGSTGDTITQNVLSGNKSDGLRIDGDFSPQHVLVTSNKIGTDGSGTLAFPNGDRGIVLWDTSGNTIGGLSPGFPIIQLGAGNLISGNAADGITLVGSSSNAVLGNFIGTDVGGMSPVPNKGAGLSFGADPSGHGSAGNTIGGASNGAGNIISGNDGTGIYVAGSGTTGNLFQGNRIGLMAVGANLGNGVDGIDLVGVAGNFIGTDAAGHAAPGYRNIISANTREGIFIQGGGSDVIAGNYIGTDPSGTRGLGNGSSGILVNSDANDVGGSFNKIGGTDVASRNVISGNGNGVVIAGPGASGNVVSGNYIGVDATGEAALPNKSGGVEVQRASGTLIGTDPLGNVVAGARNVIVGGSSSIALDLAQANNTIVGSNFVGTDATGTAIFGGSLWEVNVQDSDGVVIGSPTGLSDPSLVGIIAGASQDGVLLSDAHHTVLTGYIIESNPAVKRAQRGGQLRCLDLQRLDGQPDRRGRAERHPQQRRRRRVRLGQ